jgi:hypothetical protein
MIEIISSKYPRIIIYEEKLKKMSFWVSLLQRSFGSYFAANLHKIHSKNYLRNALDYNKQKKSDDNTPHHMANSAS